MDYLLRKDSPFSDELWQRIDETVVSVAKDQLVCRKFMNIYGPLGAGVQSISIDVLESDMNTMMSYTGEEDTTPVKVKSKKYVSLPMIFKDLTIAWTDLESSKQMGYPLELAPFAVAASACSNKEDHFLFWGNKEMGYEGLLNVEGRQIAKLNKWNEGETAFSDIASGIEKLVKKGFYGPYVLIVSPDLYLQLQRIQPGTGTLEIERIRELVGGKVYQTPVLGSNKALLLEKGMQNMDIVIGQDLITAYLGPEKMNHSLRILESILLRVKRPESIVSFE